MIKKDILVFAGGAIFGAACYHVWTKWDSWRHPKNEIEQPIDIPSAADTEQSNEQEPAQPEPIEEEPIPEPIGKMSIDENGSLEVIEDYEESEDIAKPQRFDIPPYEISQETFSNPFPKFDKVFLYYDADEDQFVVPETGDVMEDPYRILGAGNIGMFIDTDIEFLYIRNENLATDYELFK